MDSQWPIAIAIVVVFVLGSIPYVLAMMRRNCGACRDRWTHDWVYPNERHRYCRVPDCGTWEYDFDERKRYSDWRSIPPKKVKEET